MDVNKYVQSANAIICSLRLDDDGLHLIYANEYCCKLICAEYPYKRNELFSVYIDSKNYQYLLHTCEKLGSNESFEATIDYNHKGMILLLKIHIFAIDHQDSKMYFLIATTAKDENVDKIFLDELNINKELIDTTIECIFTIQLSGNDSAILLNYNKYFLNHFAHPEYTLESKDLRGLFPSYVVSFLRSNCEQALNQNKVIRKKLNYKCTSDDTLYPFIPKNHLFHIQTSFIPFRQLELRTVICCVKDINNPIEIEKEEKSLIEEYNALFSGTVNAIAVFNCENTAHPMLEKINVKMLELIARTSILQEPYFFETRILNKMLATHETVEDLITIHYNSSTYHYKIIMIPVIRDHNIKRAMVIIVDTTTQVNKKVRDAIHLTPRESEIINYVLMGEKNEYIAQKLNVSTGTVKRTLSNAYNKLGISSRVELINYFHSLDSGDLN